MEEVFYLTPQFWVAASFGVFVILMFRPLARIIAKALDNRSAQIASELAEAKSLREEAQEVLAVYQKKQRESLQEAEAMLAATRADAARILDKAEADLKVALEKRMKQATDKIAQAEAKAIQDVQGYVADIALIAAKELIAGYLEKSGNDGLINKALADVAAKIH
jgi:F-type H+-transporting ATPase subunit b